MHKYKIIQNKKPDLPHCVMKCDEPLAEHLNNYEITKFMNKHSINLLIGKPGSGKTSLLYSLFKARGKKKIFKKSIPQLIFIYASTKPRQFKRQYI